MGESGCCCDLDFQNFPGVEGGGNKPKTKGLHARQAPPLVTAESYLCMKTVNGFVSELFNKSTNHE